MLIVVTFISFFFMLDLMRSNGDEASFGGARFCFVRARVLRSPPKNHAELLLVTMILFS